MKNIARYVSAAAVIGAALILSGCATQTSRAPRVQPVADFTVVESSTEKELTPAQLAELRVAVSNYLQDQGLTSNRLYYVKVRFTPENPLAEDDEGEWAIVRIGNIPARQYTVLAAYPGPDDYYPYDYYRYGYYNTYGQFSRYGYYDPFDYNYGSYTRPPSSYPGHGKPDRPDKPGGKPGHPPGTPTNWTPPPQYNPDRPNNNYPPRSADPQRWARERAESANRHNATPPPARTGNGSNGGSVSPRPSAPRVPAPSSPQPQPAYQRQSQPSHERTQQPSYERSAGPSYERSSAPSAERSPAPARAEPTSRESVRYPTETIER